MNFSQISTDKKKYVLFIIICKSILFVYVACLIKKNFSARWFRFFFVKKKKVKPFMNNKSLNVANAFQQHIAKKLELFGTMDDLISF